MNPAPRLKFTLITLFPEALQPYLDSSMLFKAQERGIIAIDYLNLRDFGLGPHKSVDDTPYGGGDGMLMRPEPAFAAIESVKQRDPSAKVILPTPVGMVWDQALVQQFAATALPPEAAQAENSAAASSEHAITTTVLPSEAPSSLSGASNPQTLLPPHYIILCPHYEGYDERIMTLVDFPISLGHYILTGGELPALIIIDSITRLLPGVLGGATSAEIESFSDGDNLEYPQYTRPADFRGLKVPEVLLSGNHGEIAAWRQAQSGKR